jgi:all-trans-retinol dehydrogenase (NAD+)
MKFTFKEKTILITGAASGIGKIMLRKSLERGAKQIFILDYNKSGLDEVVNEFNYFNIPIHPVVVDLSNPDQIQQAIKDVFAKTESVDILINNAGIVVGSEFVTNTWTDIDRTMMINTNSLMYLALAFLPKMLDNNYGVICNISSLAGLTSTPKLSVYSASKWAVSGWSEGLRIEMKQAKKNVLINVVTPFYINTGMFDGVKSKLLPILDPEKTATKILNNIEKGRVRTSLPLPAWSIRLLQGILPLTIYDYVMGDIFGIYDTMADFKGRK